jgi:uncharacterized membrane protein
MEPTENDSNYKYGVFYYNKDDKRIIVPKRVKFLGWTFNFAHPVSYLIMAALAIVIIWAVGFTK